MSNSLNALNTNISAISGSRSNLLDITNKKNIKRIRPTTGHMKSRLKKTPKIQNQKFLSKSQNQLFSLVDIKDQFHSKAPCVPNQFKRKIYTKLDYYLYDKNSKQNLSKIPQIEINDKKNEENLIYKKIKKEKTQSRKERLYKPYCWDNADIKEIKKEQRDKLMPLGLEFFEKIIVDSHKSFVKNNYVKIKEPKDYILIRKLNRLNNNKSNIFFLENDNNNKLNNYQKEIQSDNRKNIYNKYRDSDIFNLRKEKHIIEKSGEHSFFSKQKEKKSGIYNANNETLLGWKLRKPLPSFMNYASSKYDLLNRDKENVGKTKERIMEETKKLSESFNPTHKQKGLTEFIHLSRVSAPNINEDYNKAIKDNPNVFKKKNDFSSEFYDIYNQYNSLCDKPFQKFQLYKID